MSLIPPLSRADATIISSGLLTAYNRQIKVTQLATQKYSGEILGKGSTVKVINLRDVTIGDYDPGNTVIDPEQIVDDAVLLQVDQAKYVAVGIDDVIAQAGAGGYLDAIGQRAGAQMAETVDLHVAETMFSGAGVFGDELGTEAAPADITSPGSAYEYIVNVRTALKDTKTDYTIVVPSAFYGQLLKDQRFVGAGTSGAVLLNGEVGQAAGIRVVESNVLPATTGGDYRIVATSDREAVAAVMAINKTEVYRPQNSFSDAFKSLAVYGSKVIRPNAVAAGVVTI